MKPFRPLTRTRPRLSLISPESLPGGLAVEPLCLCALVIGILLLVLLTGCGLLDPAHHATPFGKSPTNLRQGLECGVPVPPCGTSANSPKP